MHRRASIGGIVSLGSFVLACLVPVAIAQAGAETPTQTVVAGAQYKAGGTHRCLFGSDYRDLWTTPVTLEVLNLQTEAGGLSPVRRVGGQQTKGLAMKGKDGKNYTFRGIYKDASDLLDEDLRGTVVESILQDQMAAQHPASEVIVRVLSDAASVPCPSWRLVVMPDDPALGQFQKDFAGAIGAFAEYPSAVTDTNPGFRGVTAIIDHLELYRRLEAGEGDRADVRALLRARLLDIFMGDWDRHRKQWRWAKFPGSPLWTPIPEDRDQAFSRYEGFVLDNARRRDGRLQQLGPRYERLTGLTFNGWEQDRRLFAGFEQDAYRETAQGLREKLTDAVIESAARAMPAEWYKISGARLVADLKARRDALPQIAEAYYRHLAGRVDVYLTNRSDLAEARRQSNGDTELSVRVVGADGQPAGEPYFHRVFHKSETEEVRVYALDGNDKLLITGGPGIRIRMIGGGGNDTLDATGSGDAKLSDSSGGSKAVDASLDERPYTPPPPNKNAPWIPPRDWGGETFTMPWFGYNADIGLFAGWGVEYHRFGFRAEPYTARHRIRAGYAFGEKNGRIDYLGEYRRENRGSYFGLHAYASGVEVLRYYGLGNETTNTQGKDYYKVNSNQIVLYPTFNLPLGKKTTLTIGPALKYTDTQQDHAQLLSTENPYGSGKFGELGAHAVLAFDTRDNLDYTRKGFFLAARGTYYPEAWDVEKAFGQVNGNANFYVSGGKWITLALRGGGKKILGDKYPFQEAAYIGGAGLGVGSLNEPDSTLRGFRARRFGGDGSLWGNADLRLTVSHITLLVPGHWGVYGLADTGRVYLKGESSDTWHTGVGGGIWLSFLNYRSTFSAGIAHSKEEDLFYFKGGFTF
jgi:hypothetical protein